MATVSAQLDAGTQVTLDDGRHIWVADEPEQAGGTDQGPNPYELLLGSLAACVCITVSLYCQHKGWKLEGVSARFEHDRVHADDCEECEQATSGFVDRITGHVTVEGDFDDRQRRRLEQVAVRCPVHKTLGNAMVVRDTVTVG